MNRGSERTNDARRRRARLVVAVALASALGGRSAEADVLRGVEFRGLVGLPEETMRFYLGLVDGQELDAVALERNVRSLWERRLIDDIRIEQFPTEGGISLRVTVAERPVVRSIDYEGLKRVSRTDVSDRMSKDQIELREGDALNLGEVSRLEGVIEEMYRDKGFRFVDVKHRLEEVSPTERRIVFVVDEAERVRIGDIDFEGNHVYGDWRLRWVMKKTKETNIVYRMLKKDIYNPATIEEDLGKVRDLYRGVGYKDADLDDPILSVLGKSERKRRLRITLPLEEGRRWRLGEIDIEGNEVFKDEFLLRQFKKPRGGWLRSKSVDEGVKEVHEAYRNWGHIFAEVKPEIRERDEAVADVKVEVVEGDQYRVGRLEFEGNSRTRDKVLRREFRVQESTLLNMGALKNSLYKVNQLGYFKLNEDDPILFQNFDSEKKTVDLTVQGEEADRTELQVGGGWSEAYGFFGQLSVRTQNFMGRGETLGVSFQSGRYQDEFDVSYFVPYFLDRPQSIGLQLFDSQLDYSQYGLQRNESKRQGAVATYGRSFGLFQNFSLSLNRSDLKDVYTLTDLTTGAPIIFTDQRQNTSLRPVYAYDSRDSRLEPTRGFRFSGSLEYAGGVLGGDNYFLRPEVGITWFKPITPPPVRTILGLNVEAGQIEAFDDRDVYYGERYVLGGETSIRGFDFSAITVRCLGGEPYPGRPNQPCAENERLIESTGLFARGDKFLQMNLELHFLLGGPFRLLAFLDAGNVYGEGQSMDFGRLRYSAGAELRIFVPVFGAPLRFIYASNLDPLPDDEFEGFQFSIGATF